MLDQVGQAWFYSLCNQSGLALVWQERHGYFILEMPLGIGGCWGRENDVIGFGRRIMWSVDVRR